MGGLIKYHCKILGGTRTHSRLCCPSPLLQLATLGARPGSISEV